MDQGFSSATKMTHVQSLKPKGLVKPRGLIPVGLMFPSRVTNSKPVLGPLLPAAPDLTCLSRPLGGYTLDFQSNQGTEKRALFRLAVLGLAPKTTWGRSHTRERRPRPEGGRGRGEVERQRGSEQQFQTVCGSSPSTVAQGSAGDREIPPGLSTAPLGSGWKGTSRRGCLEWRCRVSCSCQDDQHTQKKNKVAKSSLSCGYAGKSTAGMLES